MKPKIKTISLKAPEGAKITPEMLAKINALSMKTLTAEEVYVRKYLMAHNGVDRDRERFPEKLLDDFVDTLPGKSFLEVHDKSRLPIGRYFDAFSEEMTKTRFKGLTGEEIVLPEGMDTVKVVYGLVYVLKEDFNSQLMKNIEAGIYRDVSIGFSASDLIAIKGEFEQVLYWEYVPPGEAREGSIVWLGAQPGAIAQKTVNDRPSGGKEYIKSNTKKGGNNEMDELKKLLASMSKSFGKHFDETNVIDEIKAMVADARKELLAQVAEKETKIKELTDKVSELTPLADDGREYRKGLVDDNIIMKAKLGDITEKEEDQKSVRNVVEKHPIGYLKQENEVLQKRVEEKFPSEYKLRGDINRDKSTDGDVEDSLIPKD